MRDKFPIPTANWWLTQRFSFYFQNMLIDCESWGGSRMSTEWLLSANPLLGLLRRFGSSYTFVLLLVSKSTSWAGAGFGDHWLWKPKGHCLGFIHTHIFEFDKTCLSILPFYLLYQKILVHGQPLSPKGLCHVNDLICGLPLVSSLIDFHWLSLHQYFLIGISLFNQRFKSHPFLFWSFLFAYSTTYRFLHNKQKCKLYLLLEN